MENMIFEKRRKGPDKWVKWVNASTFVVWVISITIFIILGYAKPQFVTMFDRAFNIQIRESWDTTLTSVAFIFMFILFIYSIVSLIINMNRNKRKDDNIKVSLLVSLMLSLFGMMFYLIVLR